MLKFMLKTRYHVFLFGLSIRDDVYLSRLIKTITFKFTFMETSNNNNTIVSFHTARGGRHFNGGHVTFIGTKTLEEACVSDNLYQRFDSEVIPQEFYDNHSEEDIVDENFKADQSKIDALGFDFKAEDCGELYVTFENGRLSDLTWNDFTSGVGTLDKDGEYDTTSAMYLKDCDLTDIYRIIKADPWNLDAILQEYSEANPDFNLEAVKVLQAFGLLEDAARSEDYDLETYEIEQITEAQYDSEEGFDRVEQVAGKFYGIEE